MLVGHRGHAHRGDVVDRLESGGDRQSDHLGGADDVRAEQLAGRAARWLTWAAGCTIRSTLSASRCQVALVQPEVGLADVAGEHLEVTVGQRPEIAPAARHRSSAPPRCAAAPARVVGTARSGRSACRPESASRCSHSRPRNRPRNPVAPVTSTVRIVAGGPRQRCGGVEQVGVDEFVQSQVLGPDLGAVGAVHRSEGRPHRIRITMPFDVCWRSRAGRRSGRPSPRPVPRRRRCPRAAARMSAPTANRRPGR